MVINVQMKNENFIDADIEETIKDSFSREIEIAKFKLQRYSRICKHFEIKYKMTSEEFFYKFENGQLNEDEDFFDWYAAIRAVEIWKKKHTILDTI